MLRGGSDGEVAGAPKRFPSSKLKLDELFLQWISLPDSQKLILNLIDDAKAGNPLVGPHGTSAWPLSPSSTTALFSATVRLEIAPSLPLPQPSPPTRLERYPNCAHSVAPHINDWSHAFSFCLDLTLLHCAAFPLSQPPLSPQKFTSPPRSPRSPAKKAPGPATPRPKGAAALPPFYFPDGPPLSPRKRAAADSKIAAAFAGKPLKAAEFVKVTKQIVELPSFVSDILFTKLDPTGTGAVTQEAFTAFWRAKLERADPSTRAFEVLRNGQANHLTHADLKPMMRVILDTHPGLEFLKEAPEFQERYAETVVYRIFYTVNRKGDRRLSLRELKRSDLVEAMLQVDAEEDINKILRYFSYEHFYVIYCKFWELDTVGVQGVSRPCVSLCGVRARTYVFQSSFCCWDERRPDWRRGDGQDHDFLIDREDLLRYGNHALTYRIVDRIFSQAPRRFVSGVEGKMGYEDFCWFILVRSPNPLRATALNPLRPPPAPFAVMHANVSNVGTLSHHLFFVRLRQPQSEEDKTSPMSLEYWFLCIDLDCDGGVAASEMRYFYEEQLHRMECLSQVRRGS